MKQVQAIIQLQGKQYQVAVGDKIVIDRLETPESENITVNDVLLITSDKEAKVGTPTVKGASVTLKVLGHEKGKKIRVLKYKSKSRYRKTLGHRQHQSQLEVTKIAA
jgi:large subunit ribosomal protein L21